MNRYLFILSCLMGFWTQEGLAQSGPDYQLRIPAHFQLVTHGNEGTKGQFGLAGWAILPNVMAPNNHTAVLVVGGVLWRQSSGRSWIEFMGGNRLNQNGYVDPLVNIRFAHNHYQSFNLYGEMGHFFRVKERRSYVMIAVDAPLLAVGKSGLRVGVESENTYFPAKPTSWGIGPRVVIKFSPKVSLATAYQCFRTDRAFVRTYITATFAR